MQDIRGRRIFDVDDGQPGSPVGHGHQATGTGHAHRVPRRVDLGDAHRVHSVEHVEHHDAPRVGRHDRQLVHRADIQGPPRRDAGRSHHPGHRRPGVHSQPNRRAILDAIPVRVGVQWIGAHDELGVVGQPVAVGVALQRRAQGDPRNAEGKPRGGRAEHLVPHETCLRIQQPHPVHRVRTQDQFAGAQPFRRHAAAEDQAGIRQVLHRVVEVARPRDPAARSLRRHPAGPQTKRQDWQPAKQAHPTVAQNDFREPDSVHRCTPP